MKTIKCKILGTSTRQTKRCIQLQFVTYIPRTDIKYAVPHIPSGFRGTRI